ncbi:MAG: BatA domain-containing protein [Pseudomonadales bacterium]|nr:BatA domain-containing protein [Pseudomonadales bacterium]
MIEWAAPLWLITLLGLPIVWWLHRFARSNKPFTVSAGFLWSGSSQGSSTPVNQHKVTDPMWWLRASVLALLILGLAAPSMRTTEQSKVTLWIDNSHSMFTVEEGVTRLHSGLTESHNQLLEVGVKTVNIRLLGSPKFSQHLNVDQLPKLLIDTPNILTTPALQLELPVNFLDPINTHNWLITDGADSGLKQWISQISPSHIIQVGHSTENSIIEQLSIRIDPDTGSGQGSFKLRHLGLYPTVKQLQVSVADKVIFEHSYPLKPQVAVSANFTIPALSNATVLRAKLLPSDSLTKDDQLEIEIPAQVFYQVHIDSICGESLHRAVQANHQYRITDRNPDIQIICNTSTGNSNLPALRFPVQMGTAGIDQTPAWYLTDSRLSTVYLSPEWVRLAKPTSSQIQQKKPFRMWLGTGNQTLISADLDQPNIVTIHFDPEFSELVKQPQYPVLIGSLLDNITGIGETGFSVSTSQEQGKIDRNFSFPSKPSPGLQTTKIDKPLGQFLVFFSILFLLADLLFTRIYRNKELSNV